MNTVDSRLVERDRLLPGIHGLRGLAAVAIVLHHLVWIGGIAVPDYLIFIKRNFGYGVHLFFLLSAFSLMQSASYTTSSVYWLHSYFIKRFFRIAPLFYVLIFFELARQASSGSVATSVTDILLSLTFSFGTVPFAGIVWGGWSVGVEMIFYAFFPVLLLLVRSSGSAFWLLLAGILTSYLTRSVIDSKCFALDPVSKLGWSYFAFMPNLAFFCMGIFAFFWAMRIKEKNPKILIAIAYSSLALLTALMFFDLGKSLPAGGEAEILVWGFGFMGLLIWQSIKPSVWVANRLFLYIGERSFSIYLVHPIVIYFVMRALPGAHYWADNLRGDLLFITAAAIVWLGVLAVSEFTYRFIEVPGIRFSRILVQRLSGLTTI